MRLSEEEATRATERKIGVILHATLAASEACPNDPQESGEIPCGGVFGPEGLKALPLL